MTDIIHSTIQNQCSRMSPLSWILFATALVIKTCWFTPTFQMTRGLVALSQMLEPLVPTRQRLLNQTIQQTETQFSLTDQSKNDGWVIQTFAGAGWRWGVRGRRLVILQSWLPVIERRKLLFSYHILPPLTTQRSNFLRNIFRSCSPGWKRILR